MPDFLMPSLGADMDRGTILHWYKQPGDRIEREQREVHGHDLDDRPHASDRGADARADERRLGEGRVADPFGAELVEQAATHRVRAAVAAHVLAHQEHARIADQRLAQAFAEGIAKRGLARGRGRVAHGSSRSQ